MQDELNNVISQAMNSNSDFEQEPTTQFAGELSDEALDEVAGGVCALGSWGIKICVARSWFYNGNKKA